jgi:hypothetical protein
VVLMATLYQRTGTLPYVDLQAPAGYDGSVSTNAFSYKLPEQIAAETPPDPYNHTVDVQGTGQRFVSSPSWMGGQTAAPLGNNDVSPSEGYAAAHELALDRFTANQADVPWDAYYTPTNYAKTNEGELQYARAAQYGYDPNFQKPTSERTEQFGYSNQKVLRSTQDPVEAYEANMKLSARDNEYHNPLSNYTKLGSTGTDFPGYSVANREGIINGVIGSTSGYGDNTQLQTANFMPSLEDITSRGAEALWSFAMGTNPNDPWSNTRFNMGLVPEIIGIDDVRHTSTSLAGSYPELYDQYQMGEITGNQFYQQASAQSVLRDTDQLNQDYAGFTFSNPPKVGFSFSRSGGSIRGTGISW